MKLARPVTFCGRGLHGGTDGAVVVEPHREGLGIQVRTREGAVAIGELDRIGAYRSTRLVRPACGFSLSSVEHLLAALAGLDLWDVCIVPLGEEVPVLDGSALPFVEALSAACQPASVPEALSVHAPIHVGQGASIIEALPCDELELEVEIDFQDPHVGVQRLSWSPGAGFFVEDLAPARTFGFVDELGDLVRRGLARGGGLDCALVFGPDGALEPSKVRFRDEPVRHKTLDLMGDLALLGRPLHARVMARRPSHALTHDLVSRILAQPA